MVTSGEAALTSPAVGVLSVPKSPLSKTATFFVVQSLDPANGNLSVGDVSTFQWVILNPAW
jgi:hypothetical protein